MTGSFGHEPLELTVAPELSDASLVGGYADLSLTAAHMSGERGPVTLTLTLSGAAEAPGTVRLILSFGRDMGKSWQGDQGSLTLKIGELASRNGLVSLKGTITGQVSDGAEIRPVTLSVDSRLGAAD